MVYLPTLGWFFTVNVGKYTIHGFYGIYLQFQLTFAVSIYVNIRNPMD